MGTHASWGGIIKTKMNPNIDRMPPAETNAPGAATGAAPEGVDAGFSFPERAPSFETLPRPLAGGVPVAPSSTAQFVPQQSAPAPIAPVAPSTPSSSPASTVATQQDELSIEKEYVNKAKAIIERTRSDPYQQANELSRTKAEFLKKRYGKDVKVSEGQ